MFIVLPGRDGKTRMVSVDRIAYVDDQDHYRTVYFEFIEKECWINTTLTTEEIYALINTVTDG